MTCFADIKRPKVMGVTFKSSKTELLKYLGQFDGQARERECLRLRQLIYIKEDLANLLSHMPYTPPKGSKLLVKRFGKLTLLPCSFVKGNENQIDFKTERGEHIKFSWSEIPSETIISLMEFYLKMKVGTVGVKRLNPRARDDRKTDLADFALRMALFADWNGLETKRQQYAKIATRYLPDYKKYVETFFTH